MADARTHTDLQDALRGGPVREVEEDLIDVAPAPAFRRIVTFDDGMSGLMKVLGCMLVGRRIAAADMAAGAAEAQVHQRSPVLRHSSQPSALGVTVRIPWRWL